MPYLYLNIKKLFTNNELSFYNSTNNNKQYIYYKIKDCDFCEKFSYKTSGTCSKLINFSLDENNTIHNVEFIGGCNGNLQGISKLIEGQSAQNVIDKCQGIHCGMRPTSCPDQLSRALSEAIQK